jgi:LacI family transcriptional regulator
VESCANQNKVKKLTIKEIAKLANVSEGTVDRVIHNRSGVSDKTAKKIKDILQQHDFSLNPIASALANNKKFKIAVLMPDKDAGSDYWEIPFKGMQEAASRIKDFGFSIRYFLFNQFDEALFLEEFDKLLAFHPDGVILAPVFAKESAERLPFLEQRGTPYLFIDSQLAGFESLSFVGQDSFESGVVAGRLMDLFLSKEGESAILQTRKNISNHDAIFKRIGGYQSFFTTYSVTKGIKTLFISEFNLKKDIESAVDKFLEENPKVEGIFVPSSRISYFSRFFPSHISMIGFDTTAGNIEALERGEIKFIISQKSLDQGYQAVMLLFDYLLYKKIPRRQYFCDIEIILKENIRYTSFANISSRIFPDLK